MATATLTAEELAEYDAESVRLINEQAAIADEAEAEHGVHKERAASAKKRAESETERLRALIRERSEGRGKPPAPTLLDVAKLAKWRAIEVHDLSIPLDLADTLKANGLHTAGEVYEQFSAFPADGPAPLGMPLADVAAIREAVQEVIDRETAVVAADPEPDAAPAIPEGLWREYPIERWDRFGITQKDIDKLAAGEVKRETGRRPIRTVGDLSEFTTPTASGYSRGYADVKGIGPGGADRISEAEMRFWAWWKNGGDAEFARERGLIREPIAGTDGGVPETGGPDRAGAGDADDGDSPADGTELYIPDPNDLAETVVGELQDQLEAAGIKAPADDGKRIIEDNCKGW